MADIDVAALRPPPGQRQSTLFLCGALCAAAAAVVAVSLDLSVLVAIAAALSALFLAGWGAFVLWRNPSVPEGMTERNALLVTDFSGAFVNCSEGFEAMMAGKGLPPQGHALAATPQGAALLFGLRTEAMRIGHASGVLPDGTLVEIKAEAGRLIHALRAAPRAIDVPNEEIAALVDALPAPTAVAAPSGQILCANEAFRAVVGLSPSLEETLSLDAEGLSRLVLQAQNRSTARLDAALKSDPDRMVRVTAKPFSGERIILSVTDVTAQSALEAHMAQSQKMQAIGQLAGGIAHDFNNVLAAIIGFSDLLLQNHRPSDPAFRDIMNIKQSAERAAGLVKQLLAFSRRQTLRPTVLNLNDVLSDLSVMLDRLLGEPVRLDIQYGRDLWPVLADLSQIEQVVINLAVNARDAMPGGGTLTVRTSNVPRGVAEPGDDDDAPASDAVLIEIKDVGTGMPQHVLDKIFEPFFTTKATGEGTGLGLSTVYGIVKQTGGTLAVSSREGEGTTFRVYLPRVAAQAPAVPTTRADTEPTDLTGNATLLLVEDEEAIRAIAERALTAKGYHVLAAGSGVEALELYEEHGETIDLLLTDVIMPELDGPSLVKEVRARRPDMRVIFMSGYADGASVDDLGSANFLAKPFTLKDLAEAVKRELAAA